MDELDLVRLARPEAATPDPDALARVKALAFGGPTAPATPPGDDDAPDTPIELDVSASVPARRRRGLVLASIAAAVITVGGVVAVATRHRDADRTAISTRVGNDRSIGGTWTAVAAELGVPVPDAPPPATLVFDGATGGYGITVCTTLVGTGAHVRDGRLVFDGTPSGVEGNCDDAAERAFQDRVLSLLLSKPSVTISDNRLVLRDGAGQLTLQRTIDAHALDGRTFTITSLRDGETDIPLAPTDEVRFADGGIVVADGCNDPTGTLEVADGKVLVSEDPMRLNGCVGNEREIVIVRLLQTRPRVEIDDREVRLSGDGIALVAVEQVATPAPTTASAVRNQLDGHTYRITSLRDGNGDVPVAPTNVLVFSGGRVAAKVGCNDMSGTVESAGDILVVPQLESSAVGCTPGETTRETLVWRLLTSRPTVQLEEGGLRLATGALVLTAIDRPTQDFSPVTMQQLAGHTFTITSLIEGDTVLAISPMAAFSFPSTDRVGATIGCNGMGGSAAIDAGQLRVTEFGSTLIGCPPAQTEAEQAIGKLLGAPSDIALGARGLRLSGRGVELLAVERAGTPVTTVPLPPTTPPPSRP